MTEFERVTESKKSLSDFLSSLSIIEGPWDEAFQKIYCPLCGNADCDKCPHEEQRNNPEWWLSLEVMK